MCRHKRIALLVCVFLTALNIAACGQVKENETANGGAVVNQQERKMQAAESADSEAKEESQDEDIENKNDTVDTPGEASDKTDIYDYVLAEYSEMVQNDFYTDLLGSDAYDSSFGADIGLEIRNHEQNIFYAFYDIDGNGTTELIIAGEERGVSNPSFSPWNYDLYGYDGTNVVHIFPEMEFGYRTNFSLYENGVIEVFYTGSAAEHGVDFYKIGNDGFTPELVDSFATVGHLEGNEPVFTYSQKGNEITEDEYNANIQSYEVALTTLLDWKKIQ